MSWIILAALIDTYGHIFLGCLIGIPLCFVNPIVGVTVGVAVAYIACAFKTGG